MPRVVHILGNGDSAPIYQHEERKGLKLTCNIPPFDIGAYATCIVDFKFIDTIKKGEIDPPGQWICGMRPKLYCEKHTSFHMKISHRIKEFYTKLPKYAANYTDFNCGHMATYYACQKLKADEVHMYGFDSILDFNLRSYTDLVLNSDRGNMNNHRLANNWRPLWQNMFNDFKNTKFKIHHFHAAAKIKLPKNVEVIVSPKKKGVQLEKDVV